MLSMRDTPEMRKFHIPEERKEACVGRSLMKTASRSLFRSRVHGMAAHRREEPTRQRYQANARERDRTHSALRTLIPTEPADRKLSKIETLRLASSYISHLDAMLVAGAIDQPCTRLLESSGACSTRPQVCTFCLAMHKRYSFDISQGIPGYSNEETRSCVYVPTNATCFDLNVNDI